MRSSGRVVPPLAARRSPTDEFFIKGHHRERGQFVAFLFGIFRKRKPENGNNENILVHRFVEVINVDGKEYRVKTTMLEYKQADMTSRKYAYDVTNIEVLDDTTPSTPDELDRAAKGLQPLSKVMKKLEKSYDGGKNT